MFHQILLVAPLLLAVIYADHQESPGTSTRPILTDSEAAEYTKEKYLQGWTPPTIQTSQVDYLVGKDGYSTIQAAINAAIKDGGTERKYIKIEEGTYKQATIIPETTVPLTLYGTPGSPDNVHIVLELSAGWTGAQYAAAVNPGGQLFKEGDPAWATFDYCQNRATAGTCAAVLYAKNDNFELSHVTLDNPSKNAQALAIRADGDKQNYESVHFYGFQVENPFGDEPFGHVTRESDKNSLVNPEDSQWNFRTSDVPEGLVTSRNFDLQQENFPLQDTLLASGKRIYFNNTKIKGDVDFIYGSASAVFEKAQIICRADRPRNTAVIFAPNTDNGQKYGFLLLNSSIDAETAIKTNKGCSLARAWDSSSNPNANGQLVIRETSIAEVINVNAPYSTATGGREYAGNTSPNRNLDDPNYNRFWEYKNTGSGA